MRRTSKQINDIQTAAREVFSSAVNVRVFGSRLDDQRRGGDIDLLVEPAHTLDTKDLVEKRSRFIAKLYRLIGEQHIDILVQALKLWQSSPAANRDTSSNIHLM